MNEKVENDIIEYYENKLRLFGNNFKGVDWNSKKSQYLRFDQLIKVIKEKRNFSILDYGCGYGAFLNFLYKKFKQFNFYGYDISSAMIDSARINNDLSHSSWISEFDKLEKADYVTSSGVFNVKLDINSKEWLKYIIQTIQCFNHLSRLGFSFNLLSSYHDKKFSSSKLFYGDPSYFFDFCKNNFSKNVSLLHDYNLYEFTIIVRKSR